jgi:hypothetical protein
MKTTDEIADRYLNGVVISELTPKYLRSLFLNALDDAFDMGKNSVGDVPLNWIIVEIVRPKH